MAMDEQMGKYDNVRGEMRQVEVYIVFATASPYLSRI